MDDNAMRCEQTKLLFDAYIDGELSTHLKSEFCAHLVNCSDCRRALALVEVSGQIISLNDPEDQLGDDFTNRLLACLERPRASTYQKVRRILYIGGPLAAAAVVVFSIVGIITSKDNNYVLGQKDVAKLQAPEVTDKSAKTKPLDAHFEDPAADPLEKWISKGRENFGGELPSEPSDPRAVDMTILQLLEMFDDAMDKSQTMPIVEPESPASTPLNATPQVNVNEIEDL